jgi:hypothetical protein
MNLTRLIAAIGMCSVVSACGGNSDDAASDEIAVAEFVQQPEDSAFQGETRPVRIAVRDGKGRAVANAAVQFAISQGTGSLSPTQSVTDQNGIAVTDWTLAFGGMQQGIEARVGAIAPVVLTIDTAPIVFNALNATASARQNIACDADSEDFPIALPACSSPPAQMKIRFTGVSLKSALGSADASLHCGDVDIPITPILRNNSEVILRWKRGGQATYSVDGVAMGNATVTLGANTSSGQLSLRATACGPDNSHFGYVTLDQIEVWAL